MRSMFLNYFILELKVEMMVGAAFIIKTVFLCTEAQNIEF